MEIRPIPENPYQAERYFCKGPKSPAPKSPLEITPEIALWAKRMIAGEGGENCRKDKIPFLLSTIVNRWFLWPGARNYKTFLEMMRAFSQPINPLWARGGKKALMYPKFATEKHLQRRERISSLTEFHPNIERIVGLWAKGDLGFAWYWFTNWASLPSTPKNFPDGLDVYGDWFFRDKNAYDGTVEFG